MSEFFTLPRIAIAVAIAASLFFMCKRAKPEPTAPPARVGKIGASEKQVVLIDENSGSAGKASSNATIRTYNKMMSAGLHEIPSVPTKNGARFRIRSKIEKVWCRTGDFDFMKKAVKSITKKDFLVSVEPLHGTRGRFAKQRMSLADLREGRPFDVELSNSGSARDYGVYICLDQMNTSSCSGKPALGTDEWARHIYSSKKTDKVLYFQLLSLRDRRVYLMPNEKWDKATISDLKDLLPTIYEKKESFDIMKKFLETLGSTTAILRPTELQLPLPFKDPKC